MEQTQRMQREQRRDALRQVNAFSQRIVDNVLRHIFKSSKLKVDLNGGSADKAVADAGDSLVVISDEVLDRVQELSSASESLGFMHANQQLREHLEQRKGKPLKLRDLIQDLTGIMDDHRRHVLETLRITQEEGARATMQYLTEPRNSLVVRMRNETFASIRSAYEMLSVEMRTRGVGSKCPSAYECVEGGRELSTQFAQLCAYQLSHSRMFSSSSAIYVSQTAARANMYQLRIALNKTVRRAMES